MKREYTRTLVELMSVIFVCSTMGPVTLAGVLVDQENSVTQGTTHGCGVPCGGRASIFQTFTPSAATLDAVRLSMRPGGSFPSDGYTTSITIWNGTAPTLGTQLVTVSTLVPGPQTGATVDVYFHLAPALPLTPGETYVIEWFSPAEGGVVLTWFASSEDAYPGGMRGSYCIDEGPFPDPDDDMVFATYTTADIAVSGLACVHFAGRSSVPDMGWRETEASIPPYISVCGGGTVSIAAEGQWGHPSLSGPDGYGGYDDTIQPYVNLGVSRVYAPLNTLVGVFLTDDPPVPGAAPTDLTLGVDDMTVPQLCQAFAIGSGLLDIQIPVGATRLFLGLNDGYEWGNNTGEVFVDVTLNCQVCVEVDIKPTSCPNPLYTGDKGVLPVAILGTPELDVMIIDPGSVQLEGVVPLRWSIEDVAAPVADRVEECECTTEGPDGFDDLILKFDSQEIMAALGPRSDGDILPLLLTGNFHAEYGYGTTIKGTDCVVILKKGKPE